MLQPLGIGAEAESLYVVLAPLGSAMIPELSELTLMAAPRIEKHLTELRELGLAAEPSPGLWQALPLIDVVSSLRAQRLTEIESASAAAESLHNHLLAATESSEEQIRILVGRDAILAARRELCNSAKKDLSVFDKPPYVQARPDVNAENLSEDAPEWQAMERGVTLRCVYHPGFDKDRLAELHLFALKGEQSRTANVPMKLMIADSTTALIPSMRSYEPGQELRASVVHHPLMVEALQWLFKAVWETAVPVAMVSNTFYNNDPRRQMLVSMLMTGSTDDAIANQLGINVRSVRRWISELMSELGVTTRLQLGAALVRTNGLRYAPTDPAPNR